MVRPAWEGGGVVDPEVLEDDFFVFSSLARRCECRSVRVESGAQVKAGMVGWKSFRMRGTRGQNSLRRRNGVVWSVESELEVCQR